MEYPSTFTDGLGREWTLEFSLAAGRRLQEFAGVTTEDLVPNPKSKNDQEAARPLADLLGDPFQAFGVFYALVKPAADAKSLTRDQLLEGFTDDAVSERLTTIRSLAKNWDQCLSKVNTRIEKGMNKLDFGAALDAMPEINAEELNRQLVERSRNIATGLADSPNSTPKLIPSGS